MAWLPFERYTVTSPLTREQIQQKLTAIDADAAGFGVAIKNGKVIIKEPTVIRVGAYTNSFKPEAVLVLKQAEQGIVVKVSLRPPIGAIAFLCFAISFIIAGVLFSKRDALAVGQYRDVLIAVIGALTLGYLLPVAAFNADLSKIKFFIDDLLEVDEQ